MRYCASQNLSNTAMHQRREASQKCIPSLLGAFLQQPNPDSEALHEAKVELVGTGRAAADILEAPTKQRESLIVPTAGTGEPALLRGHQRALCGAEPLCPRMNFSHLPPNVQRFPPPWALQNSVLPCALLPHPSTRHLFPPPTVYAEVLRPLPRCSAVCTRQPTPCGDAFNCWR
jgi:hypothetical protein